MSLVSGSWILFLRFLESNRYPDLNFDLLPADDTVTHSTATSNIPNTELFS